LKRHKSWLWGIPEFVSGIAPGESDLNRRAKKPEYNARVLKNNTLIVKNNCQKIWLERKVKEPGWKGK